MEVSSRATSRVAPLLVASLVVVPTVLAAACGGSSDTATKEHAASASVSTGRTPRPRPSGSVPPRHSAARKPGEKIKINAKPVASVKPAEDDPLKGVWTLADATKGVTGKGTLIAEIETEMGTLNCALFEDKAPISVANFVGLARGLRPWKTPEGKWEKKAAYDGTVFHRIIKGFMIQGGDAKGNGTGDPGYVIPDEIWEDSNHDRPGLLCMANRGPNTNGAQWFITDAAAAHLDARGTYTVFGECAPVDTVHKIAGVEMERGDKPKSPPKIKKVTIKRGANPIPATSASAGASAATSASAPPATSGAPAGGTPVQ